MEVCDGISGLWPGLICVSLGSLGPGLGGVWFVAVGKAGVLARPRPCRGLLLLAPAPYSAASVNVADAVG